MTTLPFSIGDKVYVRGRKSHPTSPASLYCGTVVNIEGDYAEFAVHYQVGSQRKRVKLFTENRRGANVPWFVKIHKNVVGKGVFADKQEFAEAVKAAFGVSLEELKTGGDDAVFTSPTAPTTKTFEANLPEVTKDMEMPEIFDAILHSEVKYFTGRKASNEAIARALFYRAKSSALRKKLDTIAHFFAAENKSIREATA